MSKWIRIKDRQPDFPCLAYSKYEGDIGGHFKIRGIYGHSEGDTHWMPLPEPPTVPERQR